MRIKVGPGLLVTAAFIGPGTVYTASKSGASFGLSMLWVVAFSVIATIVFQEMSARLGIATRSGLGEALNKVFRHPLAKWATIILVISAILIGNAAFESGNISGAVAGASGFWADVETNNPARKIFFDWAPGLLTILVSLISAALLMSGRYRLIQKVLIPIVVLMSLFFVLAALLSQPNWQDVLGGLVPRMEWTPEGWLDSGFFMIFVALIGTTVVPYNLFLHASGAAFQWSGEDDLGLAIRQSRMDCVVAIGLGGLVTAAIVITASQTFFGQQGELAVQNISQQIRPVLGPWAQLFFCFGFIAAGLTSAITAPLAAALATSGCLGRTTDPADPINRGIMLGVILFGGVIALTGVKPSQIIFFAQVANGFILPLVAFFLLYAMNQTSLMGDQRNRIASNVAGVLIVLFVTALASIKLWNVVVTMI